MSYHQNKLKVNLQYGHSTEVPKLKERPWKTEILQIYLNRYFYLILMIGQIWLLTIIFIFFKVISKFSQPTSQHVETNFEYKFESQKKM